MTSCQLTDVATYPVTLTNEITDTNYSPQRVFTVTVAFDVQITNPCESTTIIQITNSGFTYVGHPSPLEIPFGQQVAVSWTTP